MIESVDYWKEYDELDSDIATKMSALHDLISKAVDKWNEDGDGVNKIETVNNAVFREAFDYLHYVDNGYISVAIIHAMICQL